MVTRWPIDVSDLAGYDLLPGITRVCNGVNIIKIVPQPKLIRCSVCGSFKVVCKGGDNRVYMTCNAKQDGIMYLEVFVPRVACKKCGIRRLINIKIADPRKHFTTSLAKLIKKRLRTGTVKQVADSLGMTRNVVLNICKFLNR